MPSGLLTPLASPIGNWIGTSIASFVTTLDNILTSLNSALGVRDGGVYEALWEKVQTEPLNQVEVTAAYEVCPKYSQFKVACSFDH